MNKFLLFLFTFLFLANAQAFATDDFMLDYINKELIQQPNVNLEYDYKSTKKNSDVLSY